MVKKKSFLVLLIFLLTGCGLFPQQEAVLENEEKISEQPVAEPTIAVVETESIIAEEAEESVVLEEKNDNIFSLSWDDFSIYSPALKTDAQDYLELADKMTPVPDTG